MALKNSREKLKVIYIAGAGRSGSTLLGNVLGQIEGFFHAGELRVAWASVWRPLSLCGCGQPFAECEVWQRMLPHINCLINGGQRVDIDAMQLWANEVNHWFVKLLIFLPGGEKALNNRLQDHIRQLESLTAIIRQQTGCKVLVDSSKLPGVLYLYSQIRSIDLYVVHLVRDSRATAFSWKRKKQMPRKDSQVAMSRKNSFGASWLWLKRNIAISRLRHRVNHYSRVHYEALADQPAKTMQSMFEFIGEEAIYPPFGSTGRIEMKEVNHTLAGNPNRFETGVITIRPDEEWRARITTFDRFFISLITWPLLLLYGYFRLGSHALKDK